MQVVIQGPSGQTCTFAVAASTTPEELTERRWLAIEWYKRGECDSMPLGAQIIAPKIKFATCSESFILTRQECSHGKPYEK
jgi:hypothetical protein